VSVAGGLARIKDALGQREFGIYVAGNSVSLVGTWMQRTTTGWLAWDLTGQSFWVGMVVLADLIPGLVIGPFGGVLADRVDRRHILLVTQSGLALLSATMAGLAALGLLGLAPLLLLVGLHGCLIGLNQPARLALIPALVAPTQLPTAIAVNSIVFNSARFVGPALAGALLVTAGPAAPLAGNALSYLAFIAALLVMRPASAPR
jgi:MFS family permease